MLILVHRLSDLWRVFRELVECFFLLWPAHKPNKARSLNFLFAFCVIDVNSNRVDLMASAFCEAQPRGKHSAVEWCCDGCPPAYLGLSRKIKTRLFPFTLPSPVQRGSIWGLGSEAPNDAQVYMLPLPSYIAGGVCRCSLTWVPFPEQYPMWLNISIRMANIT